MWRRGGDEAAGRECQEGEGRAGNFILLSLYFSFLYFFDYIPPSPIHCFTDLFLISFPFLVFLLFFHSFSYLLSPNRLFLPLTLPPVVLFNVIYLPLTYSPYCMYLRPFPTLFQSFLYIISCSFQILFPLRFQSILPSSAFYLIEPFVSLFSYSYLTSFLSPS